MFVVGTAYSGSTLLGNALNGHSAISHIGEISRLPCFGIGDPVDHCVLCATAGVDCPVWTPELIAEAGVVGPGRVHQVVRRHLGGVPVLVDGSKSIEWLERCLGPGDGVSSPFVLISVRHPFAFADSSRRRASMSPADAGVLWRDVMSAVVSRSTDFGLANLVVRYEDLARDPAWVLGRVVDSLGLEPEPGLTEFWRHDAHVLGGNGGAYVWYESFRRSGGFVTEEDRVVAQSYAERRFGGWADDKWRTSLSPSDIRTVASTPRLEGVAEFFGYDLSPA